MQRKRDEFAQAMHELRRGYINDLWQREEVLLDALTKLEAGDFSAKDRQEVEFLAHKFVGTGRTYQFDALSEAGASVEALAQQDAPRDISKLKSSILGLLDACAGARDLFETQDQEQVAKSTQTDVDDAAGEETAPSRALPAVLIVDDDQATRELLAQFISKYATCSMAEDSKQAENLLAQQSFDLVLLDNKMPGEKKRH